MLLLQILCLFFAVAPPFLVTLYFCNQGRIYDLTTTNKYALRAENKLWRARLRLKATIQDWVLIRNLSNRCNFKSEQNMSDCPPGYCVNYKVSSEDVENLEKS